MPLGLKYWCLDGVLKYYAIKTITSYFSNERRANEQTISVCGSPLWG